MRGTAAREILTRCRTSSDTTVSRCFSAEDSRVGLRKITTHGIVHCSATPPTMNIGRKEIDVWHRQRGWWGIGYHWVIRRDGSVEAGRRPDEIGAHAVGWNYCSIAVCLVGGTDRHGKAEDNFTREQYTALRRLLIEWENEYPGIKIRGHRDLPHVAKDCPSFDVRKWFATGNDNQQGGEQK